MIYGSLCSGIEAASAAWHPLGWRPAFFSEIEPFPCAVLKQHYPDVPNHGDLNQFKEWPDHAIDLLVAGTPCQSFSVAGLRKGMADPRGNLALVFLAIADRYRPEWLLWENVPGVLSSNGGRDFGAFLGGLGELGYGFAYRVLDAQHVRTQSHPRAVPQRRRRVFVVGYLGDWRRAAAVLFERESLSGNNPPSRKAGQGIAAGTLRCTDGGSDVDHARAGGLIAGEIVSQAMSSKWSKGSSGPAGDEVQNLVATAFKPSHFTRGKDGAPSDISPPLSADADKGDQDTVIAFNSREDPDVSGDRSGPLGASSPHPQAVAFSCNDSGADAAGEIAPTLRAMGHDGSHANAGGQLAVAFESRFARNGRGAPSDVVPPLKAQSGESGKGDAAPLVASQFAVRRLTPLECERLQGFPDGYTAVPYRGKLAADGSRYKALGNSMACNVMAWIGERIAAVDRLK